MSQKKFIIGLVTCFVILFAVNIGIASATDYYVRTDGNDNCNGLYNNSGSSGNCAWLTIQKAANTITSGDTVLVQGGTYNENVAETTSGTADNRIVFQGVDNPVINAGSGMGFTIKGDYVTVTGFTIRNANSPGSYGIWVFEADYVNISYNTMDDFSVTTGIFVYGDYDFPYTLLYYPIVEHNTINTTCSAIKVSNGIWGGSVSDNTLNTISKGCDTLSFGGGASNGSQNPPAYGWKYYMDFVGNTIRDGRNGFGGGCIYRCNITDNVVDGWSHNAFNLHATQYSLIENNRIGDACSGYSSHALFPVSGTGHDHSTHNNIFRNNYVRKATGCGVYTFNTKDSIMENTKIDYCAADGILIIEQKHDVDTYNHGNWMFRNISFNTNYYYGVRFAALNNPLMTGTYYFADINISGENLIAGWCLNTNASPSSSIINTNDVSTQWGGVSDAIYKFYYPLDIKVEDANGNPIEEATVTIINDVDSNYPSINYNWENKTTFTTGANGHISLPSDRENTAAIMDFREVHAGKTYMSYTITASKDGSTKSTLVNPDSSWYRSKPDTYQNTVTIVLDMGTEDTTPPNTSSHSPAKDSTNISKDTNITLHIQDNDSGVDQSTIQMTVEGETVSPTITGTTSDYTLTYNPPSDFDYNQVVDVTINASDLASTPNAMDTETYSFTIQSSPDTTPPTGSISINSGDTQTNSQTANLTISATDESGLSEMKISETNNFSSATAEPYSTIKSFILSIGDGIKTIYGWFKDTIGNWNISPYSDSITLDSTGPTISNIQSSITTNSSTITFQTNENSTSQIEYGLTSSYGSSTIKDETLKTSHSVNLSNLSSNTTYHYRIISEDNLSNSSNSTDQTFKTNQSSIPDTTSPSAITDLESDDITQTSADLSWTSPGDDGNIGTASAYDIRYSTTNITESNWNSATQISGEPIPQSSGTEQSIYIAVGLSPNTKYYFAIKTADEVPNVSDISNILSFTTLEESVSPPGGGGGGGGTISDTTPPSKPSNFSATGADSQITLKWNNPTDSDFVRVLLIKKEDSFPLSKDDGTVLYEGTNQEYTDIELDNNTTYYYSIFAYDKKPNYSEVLSISSKPIEGKTSISNGNGKQTYPEGTLIKIPESFKIYIIINNKKKWIPTPEVFETLGYEWTSITEINKTELSNIPNYEDNLIRAIQDYKVYLVVSGIKRHIPNPEIFLNYGFEWDDVKDVNQETINKYSQNLLIKESKQQKVYYLCPERKIRRWLRSPEIFNSYNNKWEDIQVISKYEMEHYRESNLIKLIGDNKVYLIENNTKRLIKSSEEFERLGLDWGMVMEVGEVEIGW